MKRYQIHSAVNLTLLFVFEGAAIISLWICVRGSLLWKIIGTAVLFFLVGYVCHRIIPKITGPVIDKLFVNMAP